MIQPNCLYIYMCVCVCVCVCGEREREREREGVCVCERETVIICVYVGVYRLMCVSAFFPLYVLFTFENSSFCDWYENSINVSVENRNYLGNRF